ncbi:MAG: RagB/SusD family nutrient uptake outer membrane protein, partial [Muribaculaceae bacterium]|nr:RagB/SusD family nutrient uptake outer membrane protein [Muribaculaceae bacterium]
LYGEDRGDAMQEGFIGGVTRSHVHTLNEEYGLNWLSFYSNLHHCNMLIKYAPGIGFSDKNEQNRIIAQAYALRARNYMTLLQMWGDVPLVLEPTESFDKNNKPARKSKAEVMAQILSDINTAIDMFPEKTIPNKNKMSRPAALMVKAEALAWNYTVLKSGDTKNLTDAIAALEEVENSGVTLMTDYADVFDVKHRKNSEIIFSLYVLKDEFNNMYMSTLSMAATAGLIGGCANAEDIPYSNSTVARHVYAPSEALKKLFDAKDVRRTSAWIDGVDATGKVLFTSQNKFRGTKYELDRYYDNDIVVYRLADAHLLKAELLCYLGGANVQKAIAAMSPTRLRAGLGAYDAST